MRQREFWRRINIIPDLPLKLAFAGLYAAGAIYAWSRQEEAAAFADTFPVHAPLTDWIFYNLTQAYLILGGTLLVALFLYPFGRKTAEDQLQSIGFINHAGMVPRLIRKKADREHPRVTIWEFSSQGIPLQVWEDKALALEAVLDITIVRIKYGRSKSRILIYAVNARSDLPDFIPWKDRYLNLESFVLTLGESFTGPVSIDLSKIPHVLLGGSTGSGKSVLLKLLLMQALKKGAEVYISDFKGGVDFPPVWHKKCRMCFEEHDLLKLLTELVEELELRKQLFKKTGSPNLDAYNKTEKVHLRRLVFACDEVAEVLDKTGLSKEQKELITQIESKLSIIARQGRAFGIHLILATQRPDANLIPGQIRANLGCRICGRADSILSQIILDDASAADQIPKEARGRFLLHDGTVFQGYWFDEHEL